MQLNKAEVHPMSSMDVSLAKLANSKIFSKLAAKSSFWQSPLSKESRLLTTIMIPFDRFCMNRLLFGTCNASELFRWTMSEMLAGVESIMSHGWHPHPCSQSSYTWQHPQVLQKLSDAGLTLNENEFSKEASKFLGHIINGYRIHPDLKKITAISHYPPLITIMDLQHFFGMTNQLAKFMPNLAQINAPLRQLLRKEKLRIWDKAQATAFQFQRTKGVVSILVIYYDRK